MYILASHITYEKSGVLMIMGFTENENSVFKISFVYITAKVGLSLGKSGST